MTSRLLTCLVVLAALLHSTTLASACTPPPGGLVTYSITQRTQATQLVLVGQITGKTSNSGIDTATILVQQYIKGSGPSVLQIGGFGPSSLCLSQVFVGQTAIFFADSDSMGRLHAHYMGQFDATAPADPDSIAEAMAAVVMKPLVWVPLVLKLPAPLQNAQAEPMYGLSSVLLSGLAFVCLVAMWWHSERF